MNKTSGFREIEFKEQVCRYSDIGIHEIEYCYNGMLFIRKHSIGNTIKPVMTRRLCKECNGTGTVGKTESEVE